MWAKIAGVILQYSDYISNDTRMSVEDVQFIEVSRCSVFAP